MRRLLTLGLLLGIGFGVWDLIATRLNPLAEDDPGALLLFYGPMFFIWGVAGFSAYRRSRRIIDAVTAAGFVAFVTFVVLDLMVILRANLFLDELTGRSDWQGLMVRYHASNFQNLRTFVNYDYLKATPFKLLVATLIGCLTGLISGLIGKLTGRLAPAG